MVEGRRDAAVPQQHLPGGRADRTIGRLGLCGDAAVDLAAGVGVEVEPRPRLQRGERVRACDDGLSAQRLGMPVVRHLPRDDAAQVAVERELVDHHQLAGVAVHDQRTAVRVAVEGQRRRSGLVAEWKAKLRHLARGEPLRPRLQRPCLAARVHDAERLARRDPDGGLPRREQHAHPSRRNDPQLGAAVVVSEDPLVPPARLRVAPGAVLAHADAVTPAAAVDHEQGPGRRLRG